MPFGAPPATVAQLCRRRMLLTSHLTGTAVLLGWDDPAPAVPEFVVQSTGPLRAPDFGLLRFADGIALTGRDYGSRVTEPMARLWLAMDGRPLSNVMRSPLLAGSNADLGAIRAAAARLAEIGALESVNKLQEGGAA